MAKKISQVRFGMSNATPTTTDIEAIYRGTAFQNYADKGIEQLGIQTIPGVKFYLNDSPDAIIIGSTGIYELDLTNKAVITALRFDKTSIENITRYGRDFLLLVDMVYKEG